MSRIIIAAANHRTGRASQCEGKVAFRSRRLAIQAANRRDNRIVYKCHHCHEWHVGTPEPKAKKFVKRNKLVKLYLETEWKNG